MSTIPGNPQTRAVIVALISALSTISVSYISILPLLKQQWKESELKSQSYLIEGKVRDGRIEGKVHGEASKQVGAQLFLMKADSSTQTDAAGKFVFEEVPKGHYWLQVEVEGELSNRYLIGSAINRDDELTSFEYPVTGPAINEQRKGEHP
jgi:hypothetical protein